MSKQIGDLAEETAKNYLIKHGLRLIKQNFYSRFGEIDLIMQDKDTIVFVEVKYRAKSFDNAIESITWTKQQKLVKTANYYLIKLKNEVSCRFDALIVNRDYQCTWLKNIIVL